MFLMRNYSQETRILLAPLSFCIQEVLKEGLARCKNTMGVKTYLKYTTTLLQEMPPHPLCAPTPQCPFLNGVGGERMPQHHQQQQQHRRSRGGSGGGGVGVRENTGMSEEERDYGDAHGGGGGGTLIAPKQEQQQQQHHQQQCRSTPSRTPPSSPRTDRQGWVVSLFFQRICQDQSTNQSVGRRNMIMSHIITALLPVRMSVCTLGSIRIHRLR